MAAAPTPGSGFPRGGVFNAAVDAIVVMDIDGQVADWNPAAERLFGFARDEAIGRELADMIIPHSLRGQHRNALDRFRETGEATILNRRLELFGMHSDGTLIPVELTVTRIAAEEPPLFAGFLRDRRETIRPPEPRLPARA